MQLPLSIGHRTESRDCDFQLYIEIRGKCFGEGIHSWYGHIVRFEPVTPVGLFPGFQRQYPRLPFGDDALLNKWCNELLEGFTAGGKKLRAMVEFIFT